jgi:hypothetical protein
MAYPLVEGKNTDAALDGRVSRAAPSGIFQPRADF